MTRKKEPITKIARRLAVGEKFGEPAYLRLSTDEVGDYRIEFEKIIPVEAQGYEGHPKPNYFGPSNRKQANDYFNWYLGKYKLKELTTMDEYDDWYEKALKKAKEIYKSFLLIHSEQILYCPQCKKATIHKKYYDVWNCKVCGHKKRHGTGDEDEEKLNT